MERELGRERGERWGAGWGGWGCRGEAEEKGTGISVMGTLAFCLSASPLCFICQSPARVSLRGERTVRELFSIKSLSGAILALFHLRKD